MINLPENEENWNYEVTVGRIESIVERLESGELPLEEVFEQFALAAECLQECEKFLMRGKDRMELSIELLTEEHDF